MSYISNALDKELKQTKKTAADLSRSSHVTEAQISRIRGGEQVWVSAEDLQKLANGLFPSQSESATKAHARLLLACMQDVAVGPGAKLIELALRDTPSPSSKNEAPAKKNILPPAMQQNLDIIASNINHNRHVRDLVQTIADFCRTTPPPARKFKGLQN